MAAPDPTSCNARSCIQDECIIAFTSVQVKAINPRNRVNCQNNWNEHPARSSHENHRNMTRMPLSQLPQYSVPSEPGSSFLAPDPFWDDPPSTLSTSRDWSNVSSF